MVACDEAAVGVLRVAIAAIENAEAQPLDRTNQSELHLTGTSSSDVPRRVIDEEAARALVASELEELLAAARQYDSLGESEASARVGHQADVLREILSSRSQAPS